MSTRSEYMKQDRARKKEQKPDLSRAAQIEAEMRKSFEKAKAELERGLPGLLPGSHAHVKIVTAIAELERDYREERAERGLDPKHLGAAAVTGFRFIAHVGLGGSITTVAYESQDAFERALTKEREKNAAQAKKLHDPERKDLVDDLNKEFGFDENGTDDGTRTKDDDTE
jgi:hypothetical protein